MSAAAARTSVRDLLYEEPGPKTKRVVWAATAVSAVLVLVGLGLVVRQFYDTGQLDAKYWSLFAKVSTWRFIGEGLLGTLESALVGGLIALVLGLVFMLGRTSDHRLVRGVSIVFIDFFRGVPSLLLIYFFFLVAPRYGLKMSSFWMITLPVGLSASGVVAEVLRSGVNAVPRGQFEAAKALGLRKMKTMALVVLPQALRMVVPALISQLVIVVKDTAFAYVVNFPDLMQNAKVLISGHDALVSVYFVVAVIYILLNYLINRFAVELSRRSGSSKPVSTTV
jgi:glutamate transport system permease protein